MTTDVLEHLRGLDAYLQANIIGQDHVVPKIVPIVQNGDDDAGVARCDIPRVGGVDVDARRAVGLTDVQQSPLVFEE